MLQPGRDIFSGAQRRENIETKISEGPADCLKVKIWLSRLKMIKYSRLYFFILVFKIACSSFTS